MQRKKHTKKRLVLTALAVAVAAAAGITLYILFRGANYDAEPAAILRSGPLEYTVEADGLIESANKSEVFAPSSLRVSEIFVRQGDFVREGDLLARLDTEALELEISRAELNIRSAEVSMSNEQMALANSVTSARNTLSAADVSRQAAQREYNVLLEQAGSEAAVALAGINLDIASRTYENNLSLFEDGYVAQEALNQSGDMLDKAQTAYNDAVRAAQESLDRARETLGAAQVRYKAAQDTLSDAAAKNTDPAAVALDLQRVVLQEKQMRLRDADITAPSGGIVSMISAKEGAPASGLMFVVEDAQRLVVSARVAETDISAISTNTPCRILPIGQEQTLDGIVTLMPSAAERDATGAFSAVVGDDAYFIVEAAIENALPGVFIGMNAKVTFVIESRDACFSVPNGLISHNEGSHWVLTRNADGSFLKVPVEIGLETRRMTEIISGSLYDGMALFNRAG